ncbi:NTP transferase domain-containing protein [Methanobrevibacter curvatus]|uniref:Bifunctional protein GlmU n=1 Tax=Methanobrevibacter curvatus TaxID=49547 RepID=A0A166B3N5_9EURY|nr:NTP transferase domain-containing protein [Methanobrevibacter curvatus]KZX12823.1 bifunctional protein GlmU [Methanobrevibacter curvatus]
MQSIKHAVIIMAGVGSRLGFNTTKGLVKVGDKRIIDYHLDRLKDIQDIRIVVGFQEEKVIEHVKKVREDITFIRNPDFRTTSTAYSVYLAVKDLKEPYLLILGDIIFNKNDFEKFIEKCNNESLIGVTKAKTEDTIFATIDESKNMVQDFQRNIKSNYEFGGILYLKDILISENDGYIFEALKKYLPLKCHIVDAYEIDTKNDLELAIKNLHKLGI